METLSQGHLLAVPTIQNLNIQRIKLNDALNFGQKKTFRHGIIVAVRATFEQKISLHRRAIKVESIPA